MLRQIQRCARCFLPRFRAVSCHGVIWSAPVPYSVAARAPPPIAGRPLTSPPCAAHRPRHPTAPPREAFYESRASVARH
ncbi:unnamed protein product [Leptosia nina]|uniref:Uncharacterized protein n=1 Tax=Leptosia nina TaxID=320188 RepID=A0AAV1K3B1_9NEOP